MKLVAYIKYNETIVLPKKDEKKLLDLYFCKNSGRDITDYDREIYDEGIIVEAWTKVR